MRSQAVLMQSVRTSPASSDDWRTPDHIISRVKDLFNGWIDLDPCSDPEQWVARINYSGPEGNGHDGLKLTWREFRTVYVNYPYSQALAWARHCIAEYDLRVYPDMQIVLLPPARTDTKAWQLLYSRASAVCFIKGRLKFSGQKYGAPFPSALIYIGTQPEKFIEKMKDLGNCWMRPPSLSGK